MSFLVYVVVLDARNVSALACVCFNRVTAFLFLLLPFRVCVSYLVWFDAVCTAAVLDVFCVLP